MIDWPNGRWRWVTLFALALAFLAAAPRVARAEAPAPPPRCDKLENRQFDFWIGRWDVFNTKDNTPAGSSLIEALYSGCTLRENWSEPGGVTGGSLNTFVASDHLWHQTWTDSSGSWREFVGGLTGGSMVLIWSRPSLKQPGKTAQERMTFTPNPDGSVRQHMDQTQDGATWVEGYDLTYRRAKG